MRLIDADELLTDPYFTDEAIPEMAMAVEAINDSPTIDPVEAAGGCYCRECGRRAKSADLTNTVLCRWLHNLEMPKDGFCSYGEKEATND